MKRTVIFSIVVVLIIAMYMFSATSTTSSPSLWASDAFGGGLWSTAARGSQFSSLTYDEEEIAQNKIEAREALQDLFGGTVISQIEDAACSSKAPNQRTSTAYVETNSGTFVITAHVEGERLGYTAYNETNTSTGTVNSSQEYLYMFSIYVTNEDPGNRTITFNVWIDSTKLYNDSISLENGESFSKIGSSMVVQSASGVYDRICIKFTEALQVGSFNDLEDLTELCNDIVDSTSAATAYNAPSYVATALAAGGSGSGSGSGGNGQGQSPTQLS